MENEILQQILSKLTSMEAEQQKTNQRLGNLETEVKEIKAEVKEIKLSQSNLETEVKEIKLSQSNLENKVKEIKLSQSNLENKVDRGLIQQKENTDIIKAVRYATEENNAKLEGMSLTVAKLEGKTSKIETDTTFIAKKIYAVEAVTMDNWGEISRLRAAN